MNSVAAALRAEIRTDIAICGLNEYKAQALKHLELKTVVKVKILSMSVSK